MSAVGDVVTPSLMGELQCVQRAVLLLISQVGRVDLEAVNRVYPAATERDLSNAIVSLMRDGALASVSPADETLTSVEVAASAGQMFVTEVGLRRLAQLQ